MCKAQKEYTISDQILFVTALEKTQILVKFSGGYFPEVIKEIKFEGGLDIKNVKVESDAILIETSGIDLSRSYWLTIPGLAKRPVDLGPLLDDIYSDKPLGVQVEPERTVFRLFAPRAHKVTLVLFDRPQQHEGYSKRMFCHQDGVWETAVSGQLWGQYYGYKIDGPDETVPPSQVIADPYAKAVCCQNDYLQQSKGIIIKTDNYHWQGDAPLHLHPEDLMIYEMHVRDMTKHQSSAIRCKGSYSGLVEKDGVGGLAHLLELGVNAIELLPCHHFAKIEPPYNSEAGRMENSWNPYERNHWGYMTSGFFAPEPYYAGVGQLRPGQFIGTSGDQVREFKNMVKGFHAAGIAVILDVVYNHVSNYDLNPLKYIDRQYYFRLDQQHEFLSASGCGNDFKTERKMARRLIVDSVKYWLEEFHLDGLRFDLAAMLDWVTIEQITVEARKINPHVLLIAEPWGGGKYDLASFSERGWLVWNDLFRNGVKGADPQTAPGFIFGRYYGSDNDNSIRFYLRGSRQVDGGPFVRPCHSVNYLESHDGYTLGDFIRIGTGAVSPEEKIADPVENARLDSGQLQLNKLAALFLFTSQGALMLHQGQEFARSKVIAKTAVADPKIGCLDHNSYEKDNETNWLNYEHKELNRNLFNYYRGLIALRKRFAAFRRIDGDSIHFMHSPVATAIGFHLPKKVSGDPVDLIVLLNANRHELTHFELPPGIWRKVVDAERAGEQPFGEQMQNRVVVPQSSGMVLVGPF